MQTQNVHVEASVIDKGNQSSIGTNLGESNNKAHYLTIHDDGSIKNHSISRDALVKNQPINKTMILQVSLNNQSDITHHSFINGTNVTIGDLIRHKDKLKVGPYTFTKKCKWHNMKCMIYRCKEVEG